VSVLLLGLSVVAFSDNLITNVTQPSNSDPKFIVHGLFGLAWYVLLATQANLVRARNVRLHRRLGIATFLVAVGLTVSTLYIFVVLWNGWENMGFEARGNRLLLPGFAVCITLAWRCREQPGWHKRGILGGTFLMLDPVLARAYDPLIASWAKPVFGTLYSKRVDEAGFQIFFWGIWAGLFISLALHDRITQRRVHPVTAGAFGWLVIALVVSAVT
jgi:hypothetical protein